MKVNPLILSLLSTVLIIVGIVFYYNAMASIALPLLVIGLCMSIISAVLRAKLSRKP